MRIYFIVLILFSSCKSGNNKTELELNKLQSDSAHLKFDTTFLTTQGETAFDSFLNVYADSVNNAQDVLPYFLDETQFDYTHLGFWSPAHQPLPLRKLIFDKIINCSVLKKIKDNARYSKKPAIQDKIQVAYLDLSVMEIAKNRYMQIKCN